MSSLNFIGGEKGGVGKSVVSRLLAQYFIDHGWTFVGFDSDRSHLSFARFYADYAAPVIVDTFEGLDQIVACYEAAANTHDMPHAQGPSADHARPEDSKPTALPRVVVDLAAQTAAPLSRWIRDSELLPVMRELGVTVNYWHVSDGGQDSISLLERVLQTFGEGANVIVVENHGRGSDFSSLGHSATMQAALARGARVIAIGALQDSTMAKIDRHSSSFWAAAHSHPGPGNLGLLERQRAKSWLRNCFAAFDTVPL